MPSTSAPFSYMLYVAAVSEILWVWNCCICNYSRLADVSFNVYKRRKTQAQKICAQSEFGLYARANCDWPVVGPSLIPSSHLIASAAARDCNRKKKNKPKYQDLPLPTFRLVRYCCVFDIECLRQGQMHLFNKNAFGK